MTVRARHWLPFLVLTACDPYEAWPEPGTYFPYVYTPEDDLEDYETVRWETEDWDPATDFVEVGRYLQKANFHRTGAPVETLHHFGLTRGALPPVVEDDLRLSFVGDVMWTGGGWSSTYDEVAHLLDGDLRIGNLETPVSEDDPTELDELDAYSFNAPPEILDGLPLDLVQVNNNHTLDVGDSGLDATLEALASREIITTGVDYHVLVDVGGVPVAFLAYTWGLNDPDEPTSHELFVIPFGHDAPVDLSRVRTDVDAAVEAGAELVVVMVHWGYEYEYYADPHFMVLGRELLSKGADLVVGTGPHVLEPPELCAVNIPAAKPGIGTCSVRTPDGESRVGAILYSLGNFGTIMPTLQAEVGMVATVSFAPGTGVTGLGWTPVASVKQDDGERLFPLDDLVEEGNDYQAEAARLNQHLGPSWRR